MLASLPIALLLAAPLAIAADESASPTPAPGAACSHPLVATAPRAASYLVRSGRPISPFNDPNPRLPNPPCILPSDSPHAGNGLQLVALPDSADCFEGRAQGFRLLLVNGSAEDVKLYSCVGLPMVREAVDERGEWRPLELRHRDWCGNSYLPIVLPPGQYWSFTVPVYAGEFRRRMRFYLQLANRDQIFSNEFVGTMDLAQFLGGDPAAASTPAAVRSRLPARQ